jgi:glycosyltransferase involved in cell wall biosynthesis
MHSFCDAITPMLLTYNEAPNIARALDRLAWARQILVIDSFSTDETVAIARRYPQVSLVQRPFDSFAQQCNFGLQQIETPWVLSLDADYILSEELVQELDSRDLTDGIDGYVARFKYCIYGRPLRGTLYPPRTVLYRKAKSRYRDDGHGHRVSVQGKLAPLRSWICHDDRKNLFRWLQSQHRYAALEAEKLLSTPRRELGQADRIRKTKVLAPLVVLPYCLLLKGGILDGWPGWYYAFQRALSEMLLALDLIELERLQRHGSA